MRKSRSGHTIDVVFVLALACAFAASILIVLMLGANIYGHIQKTSDVQFNERVTLSYITAKVRSSDIAGGVETGEFGGASALYLTEEFYGEEFSTIIYYHDGWLREIFTDRESAFAEDSWLTPDAGMPLLEVDYLSFHMIKPTLLSVEYSGKDGSSGQIFVNVRSEGGDDL
jgi:hypothetical protein